MSLAAGVRRAAHLAHHPAHHPAPLHQSFGLIAAVFSAAPAGQLPALRDAAVLLVRERRGGHWSFPKGSPERGDADPWHTALRELREEVSLAHPLDPLLPGRAFHEHRARRFAKRNTFFAARLLAREPPALAWCRWELLGAEWVPGGEVAGILTHRETKKVWEDVVKELVGEGVVRWDGEAPVGREEVGPVSLQAGVGPTAGMRPAVEL
ncbi:NUDIX hydrolase domain-like protein [Hyaloraphidium curvatum]|nr:NUDIX hydrolase domain-like protein [Hyaloraphidium curvatum]